jgi:hypothetical protein
MFADGLSRRPPSLGDMNEYVHIFEKVINPSDFVDEQWLSNVQSKWLAASIMKRNPLAIDAYANKAPVIEADTGIWIRATDSYVPQAGQYIYHPYRYNGMKIDYLYVINKIGQEFYKQGLIYLICRTDISNDSRLAPLKKPMPETRPFQ